MEERCARWLLMTHDREVQAFLSFSTSLADVQALRLRVGARQVYQLAVNVLVVVTNPRHRKLQSVFVAALWRKVEEVIRANQYIQPACVAGIGVEDASRLVLVEHAETRASLARKLSTPFLSRARPL